MENECYVCKGENLRKHNFYDELCINCGEFSYQKRFIQADLNNYTALVTGARVKIGYQTALKLLRNGARVLISTRFPEDAKLRYSKESDYELWKGRLTIYGIDFRHLPSIELLIDYIVKEFGDLKIIVNNAAQTIRRPPVFYKHLMKSELAEINDLSSNTLFEIKGLSRESLSKSSRMILPDFFTLQYNNKVRRSAELTQIPLLPEDYLMGSEFFPENCFDKDGQQIDRRSENSWSFRLNDVSVIELIEILYINTVAPFLLNSRLKSVLAKDKTPSYIINVTAMEGNFSMQEKSIHHPHTNMAKAALNMMTRTSANEYAEDLIFMNSVDVGYITNEKPYPLNMEPLERRNKMPLDEIDGAARICDPIFEGINNKNFIYGKFLKNFGPNPW